MISFDNIKKAFSYPTKEIGCIEIEFAVRDSIKYDYCWMGKIPDVDTKEDVYWFGFTNGTHRGYDYRSFDSMAEDKVFDGKSLKEIWAHIELFAVDGCDVEERLLHYTNG